MISNEDLLIFRPMKYFTILICFPVVFFLFSCASTSVLVKAEDSTFKYAEDRLGHTSLLVSEIDAPAGEKALFLQAEGFYRYRFDPLEQSSAVYFAEAASAITDFPGFQSFAGSLSLSDIRLRSSDSAVQLWETLLLHHPQTKLRSLALYRLGWAYRNVGAEGLPRSSPNEAFDLLIKEEPNSKFADFANEAKKIEWKSKSTAAGRSIIPGLGQIYVGETKSGIARMAIATLAAIAVAAPLYESSRRGNDLRWDQDSGLILTGLAGLIVLSFDYTSSYQDAMRGVVQWNERVEHEFELSHPLAP